MKIMAGFVLLLVAITFALPSRADDQEKATKEINAITAFSVDSSMRSVVNRTMADVLKVNRLDLVKERQDMNLNYGGLFLAHQLVANGANMKDIAAQLKAGKSIFDIAGSDNANWKRIASEAKSLNKKIDGNAVKYLRNKKKAAKTDQAENYDANADKLAADSDINKKEFAEAQSRYQRLYEVAGPETPTGDVNLRNQGQPDQTIIAPPVAHH